jgi:uncharacterized protein (TIGR02594 family)
VTTLGAAAVNVARSEVGKGEAGSNNHGPDVVRYRRGVDDGGAWCAAFVSYCLEEAALKLGIKCPVKRSHGAKRLVGNVIKAGGVHLPTPEIGCLVLWHRGKAGAATGHVGIVSRVEPDGSFWSTEGNKGGFASKVREYQHETGEPDLLTFVRLP